MPINSLSPKQSFSKSNRGRKMSMGMILVISIQVLVSTRDVGIFSCRNVFSFIFLYPYASK